MVETPPCVCKCAFSLAVNQLLEPLIFPPKRAETRRRCSFSFSCVRRLDPSLNQKMKRWFGGCTNWSSPYVAVHISLPISFLLADDCQSVVRLAISLQIKLCIKLEYLKLCGRLCSDLGQFEQFASSQLYEAVVFFFSYLFRHFAVRSPNSRYSEYWSSV